MPKSSGAIFGYKMGSPVYCGVSADGTPAALDAARYNSRGKDRLRGHTALAIGPNSTELQSGDEPHRIAEASDYNRRTGRHAKRGGHARDDAEVQALRAAGKTVITDGVIGWRNTDPDDLWRSANERATPKRRRAKIEDASRQRERGRVAHRVHASLPAILDPISNGQIAMRFARDLSKRYGVPVHFELHSPPGMHAPERGQYRNPHVHYQYANMGYDKKSGTWGKVPDAFRCGKDPQTGRTHRALELDWQRERWAYQVNRALSEAQARGADGQPLRIDHRSLERRSQEDGTPMEAAKPYLSKPQYQAAKRRLAAGIPEPQGSPSHLPPVRRLSQKAQAAVLAKQARLAGEVAALDAQIQASAAERLRLADAYAEASTEATIEAAVHALKGRNPTSKETNHADTQHPTHARASGSTEPGHRTARPHQLDNTGDPGRGDAWGGGEGESDRGHPVLPRADGRASSGGSRAAGTPGSDRAQAAGVPHRHRRARATYRQAEWVRAAARLNGASADQAARADKLMASLRSTMSEEERRRAAQRAKERRDAWLREQLHCKVAREAKWQVQRAGRAAIDLMLEEPEQNSR